MECHSYSGPALLSAHSASAFHTNAFPGTWYSTGRHSTVTHSLQPRSHFTRYDLRASPTADHSVPRHICHRQIAVRWLHVSTHCADTTSAVRVRACRFETTLPPREFFPPCCIISLYRSIGASRSGRKRNIVTEYTCMRECGRTTGRGNGRVGRTYRLADDDG